MLEMGVTVAATASVQWSQSISPFSPSFPQFSTSTICSSSTMKRALSCEGPLVSGNIERLDRSSLFGPSSSSRSLYRSRSCPYLKSCVQPLRRSCSASLDESFEEDFLKKIQEFELSSGESDGGLNGRSVEKSAESGSKSCKDGMSTQSWKIVPEFRVYQNQISFPLRIRSSEPPFIPEDIERKANSVDPPMSLRIINRKRQWQEGVMESRESTYSSIKNAFSSMVFIIRELHSYAMHMREAMFFEDLQGVIIRIQKEMHASFAWLFLQVFSTTPTLMVYLMILLANFTVHSIASNLVIIISIIHPSETAPIIDTKQFNSSTSTTFDYGKLASFGGNDSNGGGRNVLPPGTNGDDYPLEKEAPMGTIPESVSGQAEMMPMSEKELELWNSVLEEVSRLESSEVKTMKEVVVSPVTSIIAPDSDGKQNEYMKTRILYEMGLAEEPENPLLLVNFAEFLYIMMHDYARAEEYFKKAVAVGEEEGKDAETWSKYARFLWDVKKDIWGAEEAYLEAISCDPTNSYHAANYAHFLWNTGGEDTCFPL